MRVLRFGHSRVVPDARRGGGTYYGVYDSPRVAIFHPNSYAAGRCACVISANNLCSMSFRTRTAPTHTRPLLFAATAHEMNDHEMNDTSYQDICECQWKRHTSSMLLCVAQPVIQLSVPPTSPPFASPKWHVNDDRAIVYDVE